MKPTFALDLTRDTIALLHRTPKGWLSIGEVAFDAPDLDEAVDYLRKTALGLSPMGMATKIILPASQILYAEIHAPGPSREEKRRQIAAGLEGRTPYAVEDLVFDWSGKGATVKVAVVARETLDEAEGFAVTHRLNPVSYVAIPDEGNFVGEPWFGPTNAAATIIADGETVERDREAVVILQRDLPTAEPIPLADPVAAPPVAVEPVAEAAVDDLLPGLEAALNGDVPSAFLPEPEAVPAPTAPAGPRQADERAPEAFGFAAAAPLAKDDADSFEATLSAALADVPMQDAPASGNAPAKPPVSDADATETVIPDAAPVSPAPGAVLEVDEAPFAHVTDTAAFPDTDDLRPAGPASRGVVPDALDDDIPPAPPSAGMVAFASRRSGAAPVPSRPVEGVVRPEAAAAGAAAGSAGAKLGAAAARVPPAKGFSGLVTAPTIPGTRAKPKLKPSGSDVAKPTGPTPTTVRSPARPGGTFGSTAPPRSRSGVVFLVLVALLLLCLALIAAWSSFYLARNSADPVATTEVALDVTPDVEDEMLADQQDPEGMSDPIPEADGVALAGGDAGALATETPDSANPDSAALEAEAPAMNLAEQEATDLPAETLAGTVTETGAETATDLAPASETAVPVEPAPGTAITTDLAVAAPPVEDQDEIFLSAMDAPPPALDALALPTPAALPDAVPDAPMPPPAFGTVYQFDAQGLLMPTAEGILSPDGVMLIAGKPPLVPPARSEAAVALAVAAAAVPSVPVETAPSPADASLVTAGTATADTPAAADVEQAAAPAPADPALAGFRPRARPEGLVPAAAPVPEDDARLAPAADSVLAALRPLPRPATVLAAASASRPGDAPVDPLAPADLGAQGASLAAQAEAQLAAAAALEAENPSIVAISMRPAARPRDLSRAVEAAVAAAVRAPEPEAEVIETAAAPPPELKPEELDEVNEPEVTVAAPSIPSKASVAKQATFANAINLSKINLIGTYGTDSRRYALVRQSNGRYKKVKVGDKIDGGTVKAITETEVRYQKGGKLIALKMPKA